MCGQDLAKVLTKMRDLVIFVRDECYFCLISSKKLDGWHVCNIPHIIIIHFTKTVINAYTRQQANQLSELHHDNDIMQASSST